MDGPGIMEGRRSEEREREREQKGQREREKEGGKKSGLVLGEFGVWWRRN